MDNQIYLNKQVSEIVIITQRQVLSWTEKGLVIPHKESTGAGTKRGYDYVNLLEFGLCKILFSMGTGFRGVKKIIADLREMDVLRSWSKNFQDYYEAVAKQYRLAYMRWITKNPGMIEKIKKDETMKSFFNQFEKIMLTPHKPDHPIGVLIYFFTEDGKPNVHIIPWEMDYVANLSLIKEELGKSMGSIFIDIGKIKEAIDKNL